jgi:creatinine amidohydrolase
MMSRDRSQNANRSTGSSASPGSRSDGPRPFLLMEANYRQLHNEPPLVAILPWGATEAHNFHLPHGTDVLEAAAVAERSAELAVERGARPLVLPTVPFGNDAQQLDQAATVHLSPGSAELILRDVVDSMRHQGIDRLVVLNAHGGNEFKAPIRELSKDREVLITLVNFYEVAPEERAEIFENPGDHADEMESSLLLYLYPELVEMEQAGPGIRRGMEISGFGQPGVWTPRPWSSVHPDTGSGDPRKATAEKGERYFEAVCARIAELLCGLSEARRGELPFV